MSHNLALILSLIIGYVVKLFTLTGFTRLIRIAWNQQDVIYEKTLFFLNFKKKFLIFDKLRN